MSDFSASRTPVAPRLDAGKKGDEIPVVSGLLQPIIEDISDSYHSSSAKNS